MTPQKLVTTLAKKADLTIGKDESCDIVVHDERFYKKALFGGSLGFGESYMDGWWDAKKLDVVIAKIIEANLEHSTHVKVAKFFHFAHTFFLNAQNKVRALQVAREHYDLGTDLYESFLDPYNQYTCGYFKNTDDLNTAQEQKLELICKKLQLKKDDVLLDIGCGWGGLAKYAAERYGCKVVGLTISKEQAAYARNYTKGLPVEIVEQDYRDFAHSGQKFTKIVSVGMMEHVGYQNYRTYFESIHRLLSDDGLCLVHCIGSRESRKHGDPWLERYIFPNSMLGSTAQISKAVENLFVIEDWHNFGAYYDKTLMAWFENFHAHYEELKKQNPSYDERFYRMWKYYLLICAASFRVRKNQLWQIVFSKNGVRGGYASLR